VIASAVERPAENEPSPGTQPPVPAVLVSGLCKTYGHVEALRDLDLRLESGVFLTIFGPNGAGKTTLMKVLSTLTRPTEGSALVGGKDVVRDAASVRRLVGVISHNTFLYAQLTGLENLEFYARMYRVHAGRERALALLSKMELTKRMHDRVATYSRGMQQRLSVARALLHDPELLLLDEPYTGLDQHASRVLAGVLEGLRDGTRTVTTTTTISRRASPAATGRRSWWTVASYSIKAYRRSTCLDSSRPISPASTTTFRRRDGRPRKLSS
jgi:ABC-type multidrug transport system ATPase subunit